MKRPPGTEHAVALSKEDLEVNQIAEQKGVGYDIDTGIRQGQRQHVCPQEFDWKAFLRQSRMLCLGETEHRRREVNAKNRTWRHGFLHYRETQVAGAAREVEHHGRIAGYDLPRYGTPPEVVRAGGHDRIHIVVRRRDGIEHAPDVDRFLFL